MRKLTLAIAFAILVPYAYAVPTGIEGFAASAGVTGGQGGASIVVTNLNSSGTGSLKAALETVGTRYITFAPFGSTITLL